METVTKETTKEAKITSAFFVGHEDTTFDGEGLEVLSQTLTFEPCRFGNTLRAQKHLLEVIYNALGKYCSESNLCVDAFMNAPFETVRILTPTKALPFKDLETFTNHLSREISQLEASYEYYYEYNRGIEEGDEYSSKEIHYMETSYDRIILALNRIYMLVCFLGGELGIDVTELLLKNNENEKY